MEVLTIRELKQQATAGSIDASVRVQVDVVSPRTAKTGKGFLEVRLVDGDGDLVHRVWGDSPEFAAAENWRSGMLIELSGTWTSGKFGLDVRDWSWRELEPSEGAALLGGSDDLRARQAEDLRFITATVSGLGDPRLRTVCRRFLEVHGERFRRTAGARTYHHARRGGLVEHVAQMMRTAVAVCSAYPMLNRDLLVAGVLFHDCGKLWENCYGESGFGMPYQLAGELIGHIPMGIEIANKLWREMMETEDAAAKEWRELEPSSEDVRLHLLHLIASHHGDYEFGSPVLPKTPEAIALHHIDNLDAKIEMFVRGYETAAPLGRGILERVRPLPANLVVPLGKVSPGSPAVSPPPSQPE